MADFKDMTGWRDELQAWHKTDDYKRRPKVRIANPVVVPVSRIKEFIELEMKNPECAAAHEAIRKWHDENPGKIPFEDEVNYPKYASAILSDFRSWYLWKVGIPNDGISFTVALGALSKVRDGSISSVHSPEFLSYLKSRPAAQRIDFES
jgi:hypothetical protein